MKVGIGYDIHKLVPERKLVLGGVEIPFVKGLLGHSDADVILHALCDAILGGLGLGDIGEHFPDTDREYKSVSSLLLLKKVAELMCVKKYKASNADVTVILEEPRISPFKGRMKENIAKALAMNIDDVNVKATTSEGVGALGKSEAIAAFAVVALEESKGR